MPVIGEAAINLVANTRPLASELGKVAGIVRNGLAPIAKIGAFIGAAIGGIGIAAGGIGIKLAADMEQAEVAFETMIGSASGAKSLLADLNNFAAKTPFELPGIVDASKKLLAFGSQASDIPTELKAIGDISAGIGAPIGEIAEIYGKARVQGRLFMEDINQLTGRGIPIIGELAKQFGVTEGKVRDLVSSGKVDFANLQKAFANLTGEGGKFFNLMEKQSGTLLGLFSTLKDGVGAKLRELGNILIKELDIKDMLGDLTSAISKYGTTIISALRPAIKIVKGFALTIVDLTKDMYSLVFETTGVPGAIAKVATFVGLLAGGFVGLGFAVVGANMVLKVFSGTSLIKLLAMTRRSIRSIGKLVAAMWSLNGAMIALKAILATGLIAILLAIGAAFLKARADGISMGEVILNTADDLGILHFRYKHVKQIQEETARASKNLAQAMRDVEKADSPEKKVQAQEQLVDALKKRIDALKKISTLDYSTDGSPQGRQQWLVNTRNIKRFTQQLSKAKSKVEELQQIAAKSPLAEMVEKMNSDAGKIKGILDSLKNQIKTFGMSDAQKIQFQLDNLKASPQQKEQADFMSAELDWQNSETALDGLWDQLQRIGKTDMQLKVLDVQNLLYGNSQLKEAKELIKQIQIKKVDQLINKRRDDVDFFNLSPNQREIIDLEATKNQKQTLWGLNKELQKLTVGKHIAKLRLNIEEYGLSDIEKRLKQLQREGADDAQIKEARRLLEKEKSLNEGQASKDPEKEERGLKIQTVGLTDMFNRIQTAIGPSKDDAQKKTEQHTKVVADESKKQTKVLGDIAKKITPATTTQTDSGYGA